MRDVELFSLTQNFSKVLVMMVLAVGMASLGAASYIDGFEDGDLSEWDIAADSGATAQSSTVYEGSYAFREDANNGNAKTTNVITSGAPDKLELFFQISSTGGYYEIKLFEGSTSETSVFTYEDGSADIDGTSVGGAGINANTWHKMTVDLKTGEYFIDGSKVGSTSQDISNINGIGEYIYDSGVSAILYFDEIKFITNSAPVFDSSSVSPDPPLIGENVSYGAEVYDSDGSIQYTNLTVEYGGSTVVSDAQRTGETPSWNDVYVPSGGNKWLNATLETVDDKGAVTTTEINRYLSDEAPQVDLQTPGINWKYDVPISFSIPETDSQPNEDHTCDIRKNSSTVRTVTVSDGETYSNTVRTDLGNWELQVECTDPAGNTNTTSENYEVKAFEIQSTSANNQVYETTDQQYTTQLKTGEMVNQVSTTLNYDNEEKGTQTVNPSGISAFSVNNEYAVELVSSNQTMKDWYASNTYNYTTFNGNYAKDTVQSTTNSQEVLWSYYLESADTDPSNGNYIEREDLKHEAEIHTETKKAELTGTTTYDRDGSTDQMEVIENNSDSTILQGVIDTGKADSFNQSTFQASSEIMVSFKDGSRSISTGNDPVNVHKIIITDGSTSLDTSKALEFDVDYEEEGYDAATRLTLDLSVWKTGEITRRYQFNEQASETHDYHIYPSWADYTIQTKPYPEQTKFDLIQYFNDETEKVRRSYFFPVPQTINNDTTTVPLKTINRTESTKVNFEITESGGQPAKNLYCRVDRKFGGGDFETVFMIKTGSEGKSQSFAEINEIYYSFTCYRNGQQVESFPAQIMQTPMVLQLGEEETQSSLDYNSLFDASCSSNETQLTCDYQSQSEELVEAKLSVERVEPVYNQEVCNKSSPTATGSLSCSGLNTTENDYTYTLIGEYPDGSIQGAAGATSEASQFYGAAGLLLTIIIFLFTYASTAFNVPLGIAIGTISLLFSSMAGFFALTPTMRATLIAVAIIAGVVTRK